MLKLSKYIHLSKEPEILPQHTILYATRSGLALEIPNEFLEYLLQQEYEKIPFEIIEKFIYYKILVPAEENELVEVLNLNKSWIADIDRKMLSFTIQPSGNCQLGCHYCGQKHTKKVLSLQTSALILDRIRKKIEEHKSSLQEVTVTWYGGEPLTGLAELRDLSKKIMGLSKKYGLAYSADMITNGLILKKKIFEELVTYCNLKAFQITLDGTAEYHDKRRNFKNGNVSFDIIFQNLKEIVHSEFYQNSDAALNIRCNVDTQNKENIFELLELFSKEKMLNKLNIYVTPVHDWGDLKNTTGINGIDKQEFAQFEIDFFLALHNYGILNPINLIPSLRHNVCMVTSKTSEVLDAFGNISTCWEVPYTPTYDNTDYYIGNLHKNLDISSANAPMRHWNDEILTNDSWCKGCKFLPVCGGSCPKSWYDNTPACPSFKFNIDERLFLRYLSNKESYISKSEKKIIHQEII